MSEVVIKNLEAGVKQKRFGAAEAAARAVALGYVLVGTARSARKHSFGVPMTGLDRPGEFAGNWRPRVSIGGGAPLMLRVSTVPLTATLATLGDANRLQERLAYGLPVLGKPGHSYDRGTHGWTFAAGIGDYRGVIHADLMNNLESMPKDARIGEIALLRLNDSDRVVQIPGEVGHWGVVALAEAPPSGERPAIERMGALAVYAGDIQAINNMIIGNYDPLPLNTLGQPVGSGLTE